MRRIPTPKAPQRARHFATIRPLGGSLAAALVLVPLAVAPSTASAQSVSGSMGSAAAGRTDGTMRMGQNGMTLRMATGGRSMSMTLNGPVPGALGGSGGPGGGSNGDSGGGPGGGAANPTPSPLAAADAFAGVAVGTASGGGQRLYRQCLRDARFLPIDERARMERRCRRLR